MPKRRLIAGAVTLGFALSATGVAVAAKTSAAPAKTTIKVSQKLVMKPNRYIQDGLKWDKDVYHVRSGGTLHIVNTVATEGPHTFSVVKKNQLPRTAAQTFNCRICNKIAQPTRSAAEPDSFRLCPQTRRPQRSSASTGELYEQEVNTRRIDSGSAHKRVAVRG